MNILITGAKSGIGYATALELLERGHFVYLTVHTDSQLKALQEDEKLQSKCVNLIKLDITKKEDIDKVRVLDIDVLINNAAIGNGGSIIEAKMDRIKENYEVNVFKTIELTKVFLESMLKKDSGRIIMVTSILAEMPFSWMGIYSSTKAAIKNLSLALDKELKELKSKVRVVIVEPGLYKTGFNEYMAENKYDKSDSYFKELREKIRKKEKLKLKLLTKKDLKGIVKKMVLAVEEKNPDPIYKAPFVQALFEKGYMLIEK